MSKLSSKKWKLGLFIATLCAVFSACAGLAGTMNWKSFLAVFAASLLTNWGNWMKQHPIEEIEDTEIYRREDL